MLTQDELDKLLEEEGEGTSSDDAKDETAGEEKASDSSGAISHDELDRLLDEGGSGGTEPAKDATAGAGEETAAGSDDIDWSDAFQEAAEGGDAAAKKAVSEGLPEDAQASSGGPTAPSKEQAPAARFDELTSNGEAKPGTRPELNFLLEIPMEIQVELGRSTMKIKELLQLGQGSIVELNKMAGEPADIYVNRKLMAKGEVVVVNEKFGIKLTEIISPQERVKSLG